MSLTTAESLGKALEHYQNKEFKKAIEFYKKVAEVEKKNPDHFEKLGMCHFHQGNLKDCLSFLTVAIKLDPNNPFRYSSRAFVKNGVGDVEGAIEDYNTAIHLDPEDAIAHNNLGLLQEKKGFDSQAKRSFEKADSLSESFFSSDNQTIETVQTSSFEEEKVKVGNEEHDVSVWSTIKKVFLTRKGMNEFLSFVKGGFRLKE